jgi:hypothetical protein
MNLPAAGFWPIAAKESKQLVMDKIHVGIVANFFIGQSGKHR